MKFLDFFAGIGGIRLGLEQAGHKCIGFCEWDKYARQAYKAMYNTEGEWENHDVRTVRTFPRADLWSFGFPCQDISSAGKQAGINGGKRSGLFFEIMRLLNGAREEDKPRWLLIENVKNLLYINRGYDFLRVLIEMDHAGYDCEWQVLNSKDFGVPQSRERVFIIGHYRAGGRGEILSVCDKAGENPIQCEAGEGQGNGGPDINDRGLVLPIEMEENPNKCQVVGGTRYRDTRVYSPEGLAVTLTSASGGGGTQTGLYKFVFPIIPPDGENPTEIKRITHEGGQSAQVFDGTGLARTLMAESGGFGGRSGLYSFIDLGEGGKLTDISRAVVAGYHKQGGFAKHPSESSGVVEFRSFIDLGENAVLTPVARALMARYYKGPSGHRSGETSGVLEVTKSFIDIGENGKETDIARAITAHQDRGVSKEGYIMSSGVMERAKYYPVQAVDFMTKQQRGRRVKDADDDMFTVTASFPHGVIEETGEIIRIRKLTPKECWRLQGFPDEYFEKARATGLSNTQMYKQAGNAVTVNVARAIGEKLMEAEKYERKEGDKCNAPMDISTEVEAGAAETSTITK